MKRKHFIAVTFIGVMLLSGLLGCASKRHGEDSKAAWDCIEKEQPEMTARKLQTEDTETLEELTKTDNSEIEDTIPSEKLVLDTNYSFSRNCGQFFVYDDVIFIRNQGYQYIDGKYCRSGEKLTDYLPMEDREKISGLLESGCISEAFQSDNLIIYEKTQGMDRGYCITVVEFPSGEVKGSCIISDSMRAVYKEKLYYVADNENEFGEIFYTIEYLDINDFSTHVVYSSENYISIIRAKEDGAIAFLVSEEGCFIMDCDGNVQKLHGKLEISYHHPGIIETFDETGIFLWIEYYSGNTEWIRITSDGSMYRIRNGLDDIVTDVGIVEVEKYEAKLYPFEYETRDGDLQNWTYDNDSSFRNVPLKEYQILDESYQEKGYSLKDYIYQNETIWWLWEYGDEIYITKTELNQI